MEDDVSVPGRTICQAYSSSGVQIYLRRTFVLYPGLYVSQTPAPVAILVYYLPLSDVCAVIYPLKSCYLLVCLSPSLFTLGSLHLPGRRHRREWANRSGDEMGRVKRCRFIVLPPSFADGRPIAWKTNTQRCCHRLGDHHSFCTPTA